MFDLVYDYYFGYREVLTSWVVPAAIAAAGIIANFIGQGRQKRHNAQLAKQQASANEAYLQQQLEFNSPKNQMSRFQEAGLNPFLIYGQGNPGNQSAPLQAPSVTPTNMAFGEQLSGLTGAINQTRMTEAQVDATNAKTRQTHALTALNRMQAKLIEANPLLNDEGFKAIIESLKSSAEIKASESAMKGLDAGWYTGEKAWRDSDTGKVWHGPAGAIKLERELQLLEQRFNLNNADQKMKGEILKTKEFQNELLDIQRKWMVDGDITWQHVYQLVQAVLLKLLN